MVYGPPKVGKSIFAYHFLAESVKLNEACVVVTTDYGAGTCPCHVGVRLVYPGGVEAGRLQGYFNDVRHVVILQGRFAQNRIPSKSNRPHAKPRRCLVVLLTGARSRKLLRTRVVESRAIRNYI